MVVLHINQGISLLIHLKRVCPDRAPQIHLQILWRRLCRASHIAKAPPKPHGLPRLLHQTVDSVQILPVLLAVAIILVHTDTHNLCLPEGALFLIQRLPPDFLHESDSLVISQINLIHRLTSRVQGILGIKLCDGEGVRRGINLRHHRHPIGSGCSDKFCKLLPRVSVLRRGQHFPLLVAQTGFQTKRAVRSHGMFHRIGKPAGGKDRVIV